MKGKHFQFTSGYLMCPECVIGGLKLRVWRRVVCMRWGGGWYLAVGTDGARDPISQVKWYFDAAVKSLNGALIWCWESAPVLQCGKWAATPPLPNGCEDTTEDSDGRRRREDFWRCVLCCHGMKTRHEGTHWKVAGDCLTLPGQGCGCLLSTVQNCACEMFILCMESIIN